MNTEPKYVFSELHAYPNEEEQEFQFEPNTKRNSDASGSNYPNSSTTVFQFQLPHPKSTNGPTASCSSSPVFRFPPRRKPKPILPLEGLRSRTTSFAETPRNNPPGNTSSSSTSYRTKRSGTGKSTDATSPTTTCSTLVAVVEGRGNAKGEVGLASIDLKNPVLILSQFADNPTYTKLVTKLVILDPIEVILPNTTYDSNKKTGGDLAKSLKEQLPNVRLNSVQRRYFNEGQGVQYIRQLCAPEYISVEIDISTKYYSLAAAAALLKYIEYVQQSQYAPKSLKVVYKGSENTMMIDATTAKNLELISNNANPRSKQSLLGVMNYTKTPGGSRLLRANLMQPSRDQALIEDRLDCVAEILDHEELFSALQTLIGRFIDTEHLLSSCVQIPKTENAQVAQQKINNLLYLKHTLEMAEALKTYTKDFKHPTLVAYHKVLENSQFGEILDLIRDTIHDDARYVKGTGNMRSQKCFAVRPNRNGLLDVARQIYTETIEDIIDVVRKLGALHNMPMLRSSYNVSRGYHIQLPVIGKIDPETIKLPPTFLKVVRGKTSINFTTDELIKLNCRAKESLEEIYLMSSKVISSLLLEICERAHCLHSLAECISNLDMLVALAQAATFGKYVKPEFTDTIAIRYGRHPILDKIDLEPPAPNHTFLSKDSNMQIITGPNMSGKSTYLRQVALLQVMAQVGSYVPAEYASFKICDHIFSRIGNDDDMESNSSTFMIEMREMSYILKNVTNDSLIIIDELGRGTSVEEGAGICYAICEFLQSLKAFTLVATHFKDVCLLDLNYPNVSNSHLRVDHVVSETSECDWKNSNYHFCHVLTSGSTSEEHYGLKLAHKLSIPEEILTESKKIVKETDEEKREKRFLSKEIRIQRLKFAIQASIKQILRNGQMSQDDLRITVTRVRQQYNDSLKAIEQQFNKRIVQQQFDEEVKDQIDEEVEDQIDEEIEDQIDDEVEEQFDEEIEEQFDEEIEEHSDEEVEDQIEEEVEDQIDEEVEDQIDEEVEEQFDVEVEEQFDVEVEEQLNKSVRGYNE